LKIKEWHHPNEQMAQLGKHYWSVPRLFELSRSLKVMDIPLDHMNTWGKYENLTYREFVMHMKAVNNADLKKPIILDEDGEIMDGRHRLLKALLIGAKTIKAVRFEENPTPCRIDD